MNERGGLPENMDDIMGKIQEVLADEESMKQLNELASSLFSSGDSSDSEEPAEETVSQESGSDDDSSGFDFSKLLMIGQLMSTASNDKNAELLTALKPLLREERQARVDKAIKIMKLLAVWGVLKESGMLNDFF